MIIIHGDDYVKSREQLNGFLDKAKEKNQTVTRLEADKLDFNEVVQIVESSGFFGHDYLLVIFALFSLSKSKKKDTLLDYFKNHQEANIVFYEDKELTPTTLKAFPAAKIFVHKPAPLIFNFLDGLKPGHPEKSLSLFQQLLDQKTPPELIFAMLIRQARLLIQALSPETLKMAPWMKNKLLAQSHLFGQKKLLDLHAKLYQIDKNIKTGRISLDLSLQLVNLLANL